MAPHLAEPCWMVVPARHRASATAFRAAITTYEKLGAVADADRHEVWRDDEITRHEPHLRTDPYDWAVAYREYLTDDARLVLAVLRAAAADGATTASRVPVTGLIEEGERVVGVVSRCSITGREIEVRGDIVVNAAGPWVEGLARMEQDPPASLLHLSKGVHVVVARDRFPVNHLVICNAEDKRSIFVIPRGDTVYIGTTDTSYHGDRPLWPEIDADDVRYLLSPLPQYFDIDPLVASDVIAAWAGVRPLIAQEGKDPKEMSRKDEVTVGPGGMVSIAGGKLTGFRRMAEDVLDVVAKELGRSLPAGPGTTAVPGGEPTTPLTISGGERLHRLYGAEAAAVVALGAEPVVDGGTTLTGEIDWAIDMEAALTLEDVLYRRTRAAWFLPAERDRLAPAVADHMAQRLGWDAAQRDEELAAVRSQFTDELSFTTGEDTTP
jgi:glycerol-3-phosphate dehydrogenase